MRNELLNVDCESIYSRAGEDKEQWLYETYQYTSNFDFNRLDKYEEANDDICIDDLILDYTMLYEFIKIVKVEREEQE